MKLVMDVTLVEREEMRLKEGKSSAVSGLEVVAEDVVIITLWYGWNKSMLVSAIQ